MEPKEQLKKRGWENDFYKNGYPQEVIVISDTPTPPPSCKDYASSRKRPHQENTGSFLPDLKRQKWNSNNHIMNQSKISSLFW